MSLQQCRVYLSKPKPVMLPAMADASDSSIPRRRFQFRLRTLMIGVTLLAAICGYIAWQEKIVKEREALLKLVMNDGGGCFIISAGPQHHEEYSRMGSIPDKGTWRVPGAHPDQAPSWIRQRLGDKHIHAIWLPESFSAADVAIISERFPEAAVGQEDKQGK